MLLFDSDLLCVDGLIDADDLGGEERAMREEETQKAKTPSAPLTFPPGG